MISSVPCSKKLLVLKTKLYQKNVCEELRWQIKTTRFNSVAKFSPTKMNQTEFLTNKGINSYLFTEGALDFSPTKKNLLLILEIYTLLFNLAKQGKRNPNNDPIRSGAERPSLCSDSGCLNKPLQHYYLQYPIIYNTHFTTPYYLCNPNQNTCPGTNKRA